jgi:neutral ceramidase
MPSRDLGLRPEIRSREVGLATERMTGVSSRLPALAVVMASLLLAAPAAAQDPCEGNTRFLVGSGVADITGPAAELGMMGYARLDQKTAGIHQRLRSRAFVFASPCNGRRVAFVSADLAFVSQAIKQEVVRRLGAVYGPLYDEANVLLSATHTHSGPGGYSHYALYNLTVLGFDRQNFGVVADGIYRSIVSAHEALVDGRITLAQGELPGASVNRSPAAYLRNPPEERARFGADVDATMTVLRLEAESGHELGTVSWFAVHGTSMGNRNLLIGGDNKGYASYLFEKLKRGSPTATRAFVAAFAQGAEGDVSPNVFGGTDGGGADDFESTAISGEKQLRKALELYDAATLPLVGGVDYRHEHLKMDTAACPAAIGVSMLAGAEDGPGFGAEGFTCHDVASLWRLFVCETTTTACQGEKPIVLETGTTEPYPWTPEVVPVQVVRIGDLALVAVPYESTTMAGRRLLATVRTELAPAGVRHFVVAGLANAYSGYVATREEYSAQHYEGASTHFGPWTLAVYQREFGRLAAALREGLPVPPGPAPRDLSCCQTTLQTGVLFDDKPLGKRFGSVHRDARPSYARGETARVTFWGGHPKNDLMTERSYLRVERRQGGAWVGVADDSDWETRYRWERNPCFPTSACSHVTVEWAIPADAEPGTYRIRHDGHWKSGWDGRVRPYSGTSREFAVN